MWLGDVEALVGEIEEFLTGTRRESVSDRVLATILIGDVERSTEHVVRLGDAAWRDLLGHFHQIARRQCDTFHGRDPHLAGDQLIAVFEGPVRAIRCAQSIQRDAEGLGLRLRAGIHTGEIEAGTTLSGLAVHIAARIAAMAQGNEILVSQTVRDIVAGSKLSFADRGIHTLKGVPDARRIFCVTRPP